MNDDYVAYCLELKNKYKLLKFHNQQQFYER